MPPSHRVSIAGRSSARGRTTHPIHAAHTLDIVPSRRLRALVLPWCRRVSRWPSNAPIPL
eukprot:6745527-Prymnesium_polylepis.1